MDKTRPGLFKSERFAKDIYQTVASQSMAGTSPNAFKGERFAMDIYQKWLNTAWLRHALIY